MNAIDTRRRFAAVFSVCGNVGVIHGDDGSLISIIEVTLRYVPDEGFSILAEWRPIPWNHQAKLTPEKWSVFPKTFMGLPVVYRRARPRSYLES
jgi:hypothetical protein